MPRKNPATVRGILATCERGHESKVFTPDHSRDEAAMLAGLMDGTSKMYVHSPRDSRFPSTVIGRCAWVDPQDAVGRPCGWMFTTRLFGYE